MIERDIKKLLTIWVFLTQFLESLRGKKKVYYFSNICEANSQEMEFSSEYQESEIRKKKEYTNPPISFLSLTPQFHIYDGFNSSKLES